MKKQTGRKEMKDAYFEPSRPGKQKCLGSLLCVVCLHCLSFMAEEAISIYPLMPQANIPRLLRPFLRSTSSCPASYILKELRNADIGESDILESVPHEKEGEKKTVIMSFLRCWAKGKVVQGERMRENNTGRTVC